MNCPKCKVMLIKSNRLGVETDYCPVCKGVWLNRKELDRIAAHAVKPQEQLRYNPHNNMYEMPDHKHLNQGQHDHHKQKQKSWQKEWFD